MVTKVRTMRKMLSMMVLTVIVAAGFTIAAPENANAAGRNPATAEWIQLNTDIYDNAPKTKDNEYNTQYNYYKFQTDNIDGVQYVAKSVATGSYSIYAIIVDKNYNEVSAAEYDRNDFGADAGEGYSSRFNLHKNSTYYVRVNGWNYDGKTPYMIRIQKKIKKPDKPVVDYVKAGKKKFTIRYYKSNYATKYQIRYKVKGGYWSKIKNNGSKLKYTKKGLRSGKRYTVQVRGVRTVNGKNYVGNWSSKKTIKVR